MHSIGRSASHVPDYLSQSLHDAHDAWAESRPSA